MASELPRVLSEKPATVRELAGEIFRTEVPSRAQIESVRRAVKALAHNSQARLGYRTEKGRRKLMASSPSELQREVADLLHEEDMLLSECAECEALFSPKRYDARYCSNACRQRAYRDRKRRRRAFP